MGQSQSTPVGDLLADVNPAAFSTYPLPANVEAIEKELPAIEQSSKKIESNLTARWLLVQVRPFDTLRSFDLVLSLANDIKQYTHENDATVMDMMAKGLQDDKNLKDHLRKRIDAAKESFESGYNATESAQLRLMDANAGSQDDSALVASMKNKLDQWQAELKPVLTIYEHQLDLQASELLKLSTLIRTLDGVLGALKAEHARLQQDMKDRANTMPTGRYGGQGYMAGLQSVLTKLRDVESRKLTTDNVYETIKTAQRATTDAHQITKKSADLVRSLSGTLTGWIQVNTNTYHMCANQIRTLSAAGAQYRSVTMQLAKVRSTLGANRVEFLPTRSELSLVVYTVVEAGMSLLDDGVTDGKLGNRKDLLSLFQHLVGIVSKFSRWELPEEKETKDLQDRITAGLAKAQKQISS